MNSIYLFNDSIYTAHAHERSCERELYTRNTESAPPIGQKNISYENIEIGRSTPNDGSFVGSWIVWR